MRRLALFMRWIVIPLCALACGGPVLFDAAGAQQAGHPAPEAHYSAFYSGFEQPVRLVIRDQAAWEAFWRTMQAGRSPIAPAPAVDFGTRMVVAVAMGMRNSGGYSIRVDWVAPGSSAELTAHVTSTSPGERCAVTAALTQPVDAAVVPRDDRDVAFEDHSETHDC
jgi:PrcB C-terminal